MQRRTLITALVGGVSVPVLGRLSRVGSPNANDGSIDDYPTEDGVDPLDGDEVEPAIGSWSLTVFHEDDLTVEEVDDVSITVTSDKLENEIYQEVFDQAIVSGRGSYSTKDDDEAAVLGEVYDKIPENDDTIMCRYVVYEGEVLCVRFMQLL